MARAVRTVACSLSDRRSMLRDCQVKLTQQFAKSVWSAPWRSSIGTKKLTFLHFTQSVAMAGDENVEECSLYSPSGRPSRAAPTASPPASHAYRAMRGVQLHLAVCSALQGLASKSRHHDSSWRAQQQVRWLVHEPAAKEFRLDSLNHFEEFRLNSPIQFQELRLDSHLSALVSSDPRAFFRPLAFRPWRLQPLRLGPSCLQALVSSGPRAFLKYKSQVCHGHLCPTCYLSVFFTSWFCTTSHTLSPTPVVVHRPLSFWGARQALASAHHLAQPQMLKVSHPVMQSLPKVDIAAH